MQQHAIFSDPRLCMTSNPSGSVTAVLSSRRAENQLPGEQSKLAVPRRCRPKPGRSASVTLRTPATTAGPQRAPYAARTLATKAFTSLDSCPACFDRSDAALRT